MTHENIPVIRRTWWTCDASSGHEVRTRVERQEDAVLVGSLTESGRHAPALDIDRPVVAVGCEPFGTLLLFPDAGGAVEPWRRMVKALTDLGWHLPLERGSGDPRYADGYPPDEPSFEMKAKAALSDALIGGGKALFLTVPVRVLPSSTSGHHHVYIDAETDWESYRGLLVAMGDAGALESGYVAAAIGEWKMTLLLLPGLTKSRLAGERRELPSAGRRARGYGSGGYGDPDWAYANDGW